MLCVFYKCNTSFDNWHAIERNLGDCVDLTTKLQGIDLIMVNRRKFSWFTLIRNINLAKLCDVRVPRKIFQHKICFCFANFGNCENTTEDTGIERMSHSLSTDREDVLDQKIIPNRWIVFTPKIPHVVPWKIGL